ncbi:FAD-containing monooxygenase [Lachnellula occidentalis]|uniref:FAD-containing monooxygenase n=1 Tax=Lachnellula occidentalis TaxID=215460 RepID=A0A8H8RT25_9HELO|nr:FAD-containing monooxygenase [Lachnellula occidentalis]
MGSIARPASESFDVMIIGAGLSGINSAYRIQTELPDYSYTVLESRDAIGGTWDLFRYPGIRSDSDLHTFGFPWRPWSEHKAIAAGEAIRNYIRESAEEFGIDKKIRFGNKMVSADWSTEEQNWNMLVDSNGEEKVFKARFVIFSTGYYDYNEPLKTTIPGIENFEGTRIHPQFWPEDLDYTDKKIVIVGSGATAVTLLPVLAQTAKHVTMLQRSPTYILSRPSVDPVGTFIRKVLPSWLASRIVRYKFLVLPFLFFKFCSAYPEAARRLIHKSVKAELPPTMSIDPDFNPRYNPWEQRLCVCPDGDFYQALRSGNADVVTDTIARVTATGIETQGGKVIDADIIITATGLKMQLAGGASISLNGTPLSLPSTFAWNSTMLSGIPNAAIIIGYTNASWTLGADAAAKLLIRLLKYMRKNDFSSAMPSVGDEGMQKQSLMNLNSTYVEKAKGDLPSAGDRSPWLPRSNYFVDYWGAAHGDLTGGMEFTSADAVGKKIN